MKPAPLEWRATPARLLRRGVRSGQWMTLYLHDGRVWLYYAGHLTMETRWT